MLALFGMILPSVFSLISWFLSKSSDGSKEHEAMWEQFQIFIKAVDAHRSMKVHDSAKSQRDKLKDL